MNTNHDELERLLGDELHDRADDMTAPACTSATCRAGRSSIRRHRRIAAGCRRGRRAGDRRTVSRSSAGGSIDDQQAGAAPAPARPQLAQTTLTLDGLERGDAPRIEYFTADGVVLPGEGLQTAGRQLPGDGAERRRRWLALSPGLDELPDGWTRTSSRSTSVQRQRQSFVEQPGPLVVAWTTTVDQAAQTLVQAPTNGGELGERGASRRSPRSTRSTSWATASVLYQTHRRTAVDTRPSASRQPTARSSSRVASSRRSQRARRPGWSPCRRSSNADGSGCFGVVDPAASTAESVWETCDYSLGAFSPDGRYVLASDPYQSGAGPPRCRVLDARTGDLVASFRPERGTQVTLINLVWESTDTLPGHGHRGREPGCSSGSASTASLEEPCRPLDGDPLGDQAFYLGSPTARAGSEQRSGQHRRSPAARSRPAGRATTGSGRGRPSRRPARRPWRRCRCRARASGPGPGSPAPSRAPRPWPGAASWRRPRRR